MARQARLKSESGIYHVMLRGNERRPVFLDDEDKQRFMEIMLQKKQSAAGRLYAFCILDNHVHMVCQEVEQPLYILMKRIGVTYAAYFNKKHHCIGPVFQDRFRSEAIEDESYLLCAIRYVHNNPVKTAGEFTLEYPWSSYSWYMGCCPDEGIPPEMDETLSLFDANRSKALQLFQEFHLQEEPRQFLEVAATQTVRKDPNELIAAYLQDRQWTSAELCKSENLSAAVELVRMLLANGGVSGRQIAQLTGINREKVRRIAVAVEPSL